MTAKARVARNLRKFRVRREVSQEALAVDAGIDRTYVSRLERSLENPTVGVLERLAAALEIDIADFFGRPRPNEPIPRPLPGGRKPARRR